LTELVRTLKAAQNQPPPPPPPVSTQAEASPSTIFGGTTPFSTLQQTTPEGRPWGTPICLAEVFRPTTCRPPPPTVQHTIFVPPPAATQAQATVTYSAPRVHTTPQDEEPIFHSGNMGPYDRVDDLQERFEIMNQEVQALRGKETFKKDVYDLCLVPNVQVPHKFKLLDIEKYKGTSCPKDHLTMYVRKMSTYAHDDQVLIHYFQDSLTGTALKWYMNLDRAEIRTFNDLREAFVQQYKFNVDMVPDRSDLQSMTQKGGETLKEYAQQWKDVVVQVNPRIEEKEMTKLFLKTLNQFYYERMVGSVPRDFTKMVSMGIQLEEGVREGRLAKGNESTSSTKKFGSHLPKKKEQEVGMVAQGGPQQNCPAYQHIAAITPSTNAIQP